jgi:hypothetical protein
MEPDGASSVVCPREGRDIAVTDPRHERDLGCANKFLGGDIATENIFHIVLHSVGSQMPVRVGLVEQAQDRTHIGCCLLAVEAGSPNPLPIVEASVVAESAGVVVHCDVKR